MDKELHIYYSLSECQQTDKLFKHLDKLQEEAKIEWSKSSREVIKIEDIDLEDNEIDELASFLDKMDVIPDTDIDDDDLSDNDDWGIDEDEDGY